jgi:putative oxidoreductase
MKKKIIFLVGLCFIELACVQKTSKRTVVGIVDISHEKDIQTVGLRGKGKPLSWDDDILLEPLIKDSLYTLTLTVNTPYDFAEIKFTKNGKFELEGKDNRRVYFDQKNDTTFYRAKFNIDDTIKEK